MSYEIVKSISIKSNGITINSATNNVYPHTYEKWKYCKDDDLQTAKFKFMLDVLDGNFQFNQLNKSTLPYAHAKMRVRQWMEEKVLSDYHDFYEKRHGLSFEEQKDLYKEPYKVWCDALAETDSECVVRCNKYHIKGGEFIFVKPPKYGLYGFMTISYTTNAKEAVTSRKRAEILLYEFNHGWEEQRMHGMKLFITLC